MKVSELEWNKIENKNGSVWFGAACDKGFFTVLVREAGFCFEPPDTETSFTTAVSEFKFSLRSGMFDIRSYPDLTIEEAIKLIKGVE